MSFSRVPNSAAALRERVTSLSFGILFLALTAAIAFVWSSARLLEIDEYLSFYTDRVPSMADVVRVQLHYPISLDPPTYHLLSHLAMRLLGPTALAVRLPAFLGFVLFQISVFFFVRRIAGWRSASLALALPLLTFSFFYAVQGRPYGLLLGLYAMSLACWQAATRAAAGQSRMLALVGLASAVALAITSHYFGMLILLPVCIGELARSMHRRRLDYGVLAAFAVGMVSIISILPFRKALLLYRLHYYSTSVDWHIIPESYCSLFAFYRAWPHWQQHLYEFSLCAVTLALAVAVLLRLRHEATRDCIHEECDPVHEWVALFSIALLPIFGYLFGRFVTHTMDARYVIAALFAFVACTAIVFQRALRSSIVFYSAIALLFVGAVKINCGQIRMHRAGGAGTMASFNLSPEASAAFASDPQRRIYTQALDSFYINTAYEPDPAIRSRFCLVYGQDEELGWLGHDTNYITAINMQHFAPLCTVSYRDFLAQPDPLILVYHSSWEWLEGDLAAKRLPVTAIGPALRGDLVQLHTTSMPNSTSLHSMR
jgi:hypothetical protein